MCHDGALCNGQAESDADHKAGKSTYWENKKAIHVLTHSETLNEAELEKRVDESLMMKKERAMEWARFHHEMFIMLTPGATGTIEGQNG